MNRIVTDEENYPIQPQDINASRHFFDAFDNNETEISAGWVVRFLQERKLGWKPFQLRELEEFYAKKYSHGFRFNRLIEPQEVPVSLVEHFGRMAHHASLCRGANPLEASLSWQMEMAARPPETKQVGGGWIIPGPNGILFVTEDFIQRCYKSSPAAKAA